MASLCSRVGTAICVLRNVRHRNERFLSTSTFLQASGEDLTPKFTPPPKPVILDKTKSQASLRKFLSPEFIPPRQRTSPLKFAVERKDMIERRKVLNIPEFYVGSILAVTMADPHSNGKVNRFVGICIRRSGKGLGATFVLRNVVEGQGVEICYEMYNPRLQLVEVLKLEKRLDDDLVYLRDALPEYSTFDFNMKPISSAPSGDVPVNTLKVRMKPKPWSKRWERPKFKVQGIRFDLCLSDEKMEEAKKWDQPWLEFDMLKEYDTSRLEESIWQEVQMEMSK